MFHIFKNKPYLSDLIPDNHVDFHSHLLYGIDDGAKTAEDTLLLIKELQNSGITQYITTPHVMTGVWDNTSEIISNKLVEVQQLLSGIGVKFKIKAAAEYYIDDNFLKLFQKERLLTIKDNYVLVELSYLNAPMQLFDILFELQLEGYIPVLAHPERYTFYHKSIADYRKLKNAGCLFQLNMLSTVGYYGKEVTAAAAMLLKEGMIDFTGSDVHHIGHVRALQKRIVTQEKTSIRTAMKNNTLFAT